MPHFPPLSQFDAKYKADILAEPIALSHRQFTAKCGDRRSRPNPLAGTRPAAPRTASQRRAV